MESCDNTEKVCSWRCGRCVSPLHAMVVSFCMLLSACGDGELDAGTGTDAVGEGTWVRLTVSLPQTAFPQRSTEAVSRSAATENLIGEMLILVFERIDGRYVYRYMAAGERIQAVGSTTQFKARLLSTPNPVKLMLAGNYGDAFADYAPSPGVGEEVVRTDVGCSFPGTGEGLPMFGEVEIPAGLQAVQENSFGVKMLRAVARVDVERNLDADSRPFRIESVRLYRPNDKVQIAPDEAVSGDAPKVTRPSVFRNAEKASVPLKVTATEADPASVTGIYAPEADGETDPAVQLTGTTCLVVGGYYDEQTQPSYYRVDFNSGIEGHPFGQILRNHRYIFRIRKVTGTGWSDPDAAAVNRASSIVAEIEAWEDFTTEMYFEGENHFGVSSRILTLGYLAGNTGRVDVQATLPYTIQWLDASGSPVGSAVSGVGASLPDNGGFTVSIDRGSGDAETVSHLIFTTVGDNRTASDAKVRLRVVAGRWTLEITAVQKSPEKYRRRFVRVLSVTEIGSLGTNNPSSASGLPLRKILDNTKNFSPDGTVIIGGFSFTEASRTDMQATSGSDIFQNLKNTIYTQDVIYLTYNTPISDELAKVVLAWLQGGTNRVLIVGTDTDATNANLRKYLVKDGTWKYYYQSPVVGGKFRRAAQTDSNRRFFVSPFGTVAENASIARADDYAAYCTDYPSGVVPLVGSDVAGYEKAMVVGVNMQDRIVYHGDANLNQNGRLSSQANTNGTVTTDFDRLMANLWAWIVEQVCRE